MHGCGIKLLTDNSEPTEQAGHFVDDEYIGPSNVCSVADVQQAAKQALAAAHLASGLQVSCCHNCAPQRQNLHPPASNAHVLLCRRGKVLNFFMLGVISHIKGS